MAKREENAIRFYGAEKDRSYWMFSNFAELKMVMDGLSFPTVEHWIQYMKFVTTDPNHAEKIRKAPTPYECRKLAKMPGHTPDQDWRSKELRLMNLALFCKALQHPEFAQTLLDTGRADLVEAAPHDYFWGIGKDGTGKNWLGRLLTQLRKNLYFNKNKMVSAEETEISSTDAFTDATIPPESPAADEEDEIIDEGWDEQAQAEAELGDDDVEVEED